MNSFSSPTITTILNNIQSDINSQLIGADSTLTNSVLNVIATVLAGVAYGEYGFIVNVSNQIFPDTATSGFLRRWGAIWGVTPIAANPASGNVICTGSNGVVIPSGTVFQRADTALFTSTADETISGGTATVPVTAQVAGLASNTAPSATMTFVSPITFVTNIGTVDGTGLVNGLDPEADAPYLQRLLKRIQTPPQGGAATDYVSWALAFPGVTRAWCTPGAAGSGFVGLQFMMDNTYSNGIPLSGDVTALTAYLNILRPVTAILGVSAPTANVVNFTIHLNIANTAAIKAEIQANLAALILSDGVPGGTLYLSRINEAISSAPGEYDNVMTVPSANVVSSTGYIPVMGTITWA